MKQTIQKVFDKDTSLPERICTFTREQIVFIILTLTTFVTGITTIVLSAIGDFGGWGGEGEEEGVLHQKIKKPWKNGYAGQQIQSKKLAGKAVEALPAIVGSPVVAILSFLGKAVRFVATHTCFCCRTYWCMIGAKGIEEASTKRNNIFANLLTN